MTCTYFFVLNHIHNIINSYEQGTKLTHYDHLGPVKPFLVDDRRSSAVKKGVTVAKGVIPSRRLG